MKTYYVITFCARQNYNTKISKHRCLWSIHRCFENLYHLAAALVTQLHTRLIMCSYYFLEVTLNVLDRKGDIVDVNEGKFSFYIKEALKEVFGQFGSSVNFDVLSFKAGKGIIRCPSTFYVKFRGALTLFGRHNSNTVAFNVHRGSSCLISFITEDSTYKHVTNN